MAVKRAGRTLQVPIALMVDHKSGEDLFVYLLAVAQNFLFAALGLLLLWRGQRQAAFAVGLWCLVNVAADVFSSLPLGFYLSVALTELGNDLVLLGTLVALYLLADDLTQEGVSGATRLRMRIVFILLFTLYTTALLYTKVIAFLDGTPPTVYHLVVPVHLLTFAVPLLLLAFCYRRAPTGDRARIRWVAASMLLFVASYLMSVFGARFLNALQDGLMITLLTAMAFLGLTYAVLRHRLVSLQLVLNRALVYGVITSLVVGVFAAISSLVQHFAIGGTESALLQLLVPLTLGVTLNMLKRRLDLLVERFFFQRQYQAEAALSRFAKECGFIENLETLLDRTRDEVFDNLRTTGVALYESGPSGYARLRQRGEREFRAEISVDDPALVSLRASLAEADLDKLKSTLGNEGLVFPLAVRGGLAGALVIGQRPAEQYTQNERALLSRLTAQVAGAMHALRAKEAEAFVEAVARGAFAAAPETRSKAKELMSQQLAAA
jgi:GAF domain-containing protein